MSNSCLGLYRAASPIQECQIQIWTASAALLLLTLIARAWSFQVLDMRQLSLARCQRLGGNLHISEDMIFVGNTSFQVCTFLCFNVSSHLHCHVSVSFAWFEHNDADKCILLTIEKLSAYQEIMVLTVLYLVGSNSFMVNVLLGKYLNLGFLRYRIV